MIAALIGTWWAWLAAAVAFGTLEVLLPVFAFLGFALGAALTGLVLLLGLPLGPGGTMMLFAVLSALAFGALRLALGRDRGRERVVTRDLNDYR